MSLQPLLRRPYSFAMTPLEEIQHLAQGRPPASPVSYVQVTRTATYAVLLSAPLLVLYEVLILLANRGALMQVRVGADVWIKTVLAAVGITGTLALSVLIMLAGTLLVAWERRRSGPVPLRPRYFGWMIAESLAYAIVLAFAVSLTVSIIFARIAPPAPGLLAELALSLGAGLYEELVFRVLLVGGLFWVLRRVLTSKTAAYALAAVVGALVFSAVHYVGALGDAFTLQSFTFRFLFGLALNAVFLLRGFGIAAWTHALYDVLVVTRLLG